MPFPRGRAHRIRPSATCTQATVSIMTSRLCGRRRRPGAGEREGPERDLDPAGGRPECATGLRVTSDEHARDAGGTDRRRGLAVADKWLTFDCYGTIADWNSGMGGPLRALAGAD